MKLEKEGYENPTLIQIKNAKTWIAQEKSKD
jgi:hypothetical protein